MTRFGVSLNGVTQFQSPSTNCYGQLAKQPDHQGVIRVRGLFTVIYISINPKMNYFGFTKLFPFLHVNVPVYYRRTMSGSV